MQVILTLRTWAVWGRDRRLTIGLPIFLVICMAPPIGVTVSFMKSAECKHPSINGGVTSNGFLVQSQEDLSTTCAWMSDYQGKTDPSRIVGISTPVRGWQVTQFTMTRTETGGLRGDRDILIDAHPGSPLL